ncbi:MAG: hypothetical protein ACPGYY_08345 [Bacteroidia bacterium]
MTPFSKLIVLFTVLLSAACSPTDHNSHESNSDIELNNGKKWIVVPEMFAYITSIEDDINEFEGKTLVDHQQLSTQISTTLGKLTSNCTMTGKGHDELHKWLLPFLDMADEYKNSSSTENASKVLSEMKESYTVLHSNFE